MCELLALLFTRRSDENPSDESSDCRDPGGQQPRLQQLRTVPVLGWKLHADALADLPSSPERRKSSHD